MEKVRVAIVGAGVAGASTAYFLAQRGIRGVTLFEREKDPGAHSTGRNAAILRSAIEDPVLHALARESADFYRSPPPGFCDHPLVDPVGLYMAAPAGAEEVLDGWVHQSNCQRGLVQVDPAEIYAKVPLLVRELAVAYSQPDEGVMDVAAILSGFLKGAREGGAQLKTNVNVRALERDGDTLTRLETDDGSVQAEAVVLAGGAWAAELAASSGLALPLTPYKRHILVTEALDAVNPRWPVVWIGGDEFYFRPESGGLLVSPCDTTAAKPEETEVVDAAMKERAAEKTHRWLPELVDAGVAHFWSGARTFAPDHRFVLGPDPRCTGLYWAAGLGGHGVSSAVGVGRILAEWIVDGRSGTPSAAELRPDRLLELPETGRLLG